MHGKLTAKGNELVAEYQKRLRRNPKDSFILLNMSVEQNFPPIAFCRILLNTIFKGAPKSEITKMLRNFNLIEDPYLSLNVSHCIFNDHQEGAMTDASRRCIGEEFEIRLKEAAKHAGLYFFDEGDLRRDGYDKTPDLKLAVPLLYKPTDQVVYWIESKALFGDPDSHSKYLEDQLLSYGNRFGHGMVIYWLGYLDEIAYSSENYGYVTVVNKFPDASEIDVIQFNDEGETVECNSEIKAKLEDIEESTIELEEQDSKD